MTTTTRNDTNEVREPERQGTAVRRGSDRERAVESSRETGRTGVARRDQPQWGLSTGGFTQSPFTMMRRMMEDMDRLFEGFGFGRLASPFLAGAGGATDAVWTPAVEILEKGNDLIVRAELPGVSRDDVSVDVTENVLTIQGERRHESEEQEEGFYRSERSYGKFLRTIPLPEGIDGEKADATFSDGVLEIRLPAPKREQRKGRKIAIR